MLPGNYGGDGRAQTPPAAKLRMEYRDWGKAGVHTSLLGYGCMRLPTTTQGEIDEPRAEALLNAARDAGVNYFDTAHFYHSSQSEPFVGKVIAKWPRDSFYVATKLPLWKMRDWGDDSLEEAKKVFQLQLDRLGVEYFDFYLLHSLHRARYDEAKARGIVDWLWQEKAAGRIRNFGFSFHDNYAGLEHILRDQPWDFCQIQYNYLDTDERAEEVPGSRGYALTEELGIPLILMEPVKGGPLAAPAEDGAAPLRAQDPSASMASWALRWVANHPNVRVVLSGMSDEKQLADNLATFSPFVPLTAQETAAVDTVAQELRSRIKIGWSGRPGPAGTVCPAPWGWISRIISASGTAWGCSGSRSRSSSAGKPSSPMRKKPITASAAANAKLSAPSSCPSAPHWPSCSRSWTHCKQQKTAGYPLPFFAVFTTDGSL